jgi:hypothetical protein
MLPVSIRCFGQLPVLSSKQQTAPTNTLAVYWRRWCDTCTCARHLSMQACRYCSNSLYAPYLTGVSHSPLGENPTINTSCPLVLVTHIMPQLVI